jgi:hypothetical protein
MREVLYGGLSRRPPGPPSDGQDVVEPNTTGPAQFGVVSAGAAADVR